MSAELSSYLFDASFDFELRTYQLLALESRIAGTIQKCEIYPSYAELIQWQAAIESLLDAKKVFEKSLPSTINQIDLEKKAISYNSNELPSLKLLEEMHKWAVKAQSKINALILEFEDMKNEFLLGLESGAVGVLPIYRDEGYFLITHDGDTDVFTYQRKSLFNAINSTREISSNYFKTYEVSISNTPQNIKLLLLEKNKEIPNPATWIFNSPTSLPLIQTLLPLAKEKLAKIIDK